MTTTILYSECITSADTDIHAVDIYMTAAANNPDMNYVRHMSQQTQQALIHDYITSNFGNAIAEGCPPSHDKQINQFAK